MLNQTRDYRTGIFHWERFSVEVGIKPRWIEKTVGEISRRMLPLADSVSRDFTETYGPSVIVEKVVRFIRKGASRLAGPP
jgi:hypothetical protein